MNITSHVAATGRGIPFESSDLGALKKEIIHKVTQRGGRGRGERNLIKFDDAGDKQVIFKASLSTVSRRNVQLAYIFE